MSECTLKERMHSFALGILLAVILMVIGGGMVLITWAASGSTPSYALNRTGRLMMERSALLAAAVASFPAPLSDHEND